MAWLHHVGTSLWTSGQTRQCIITTIAYIEHIQSILYLCLLIFMYYLFQILANTSTDFPDSLLHEA